MNRYEQVTLFRAHRHLMPPAAQPFRCASSRHNKGSAVCSGACIIDLCCNCIMQPPCRARCAHHVVSKAQCAGLVVHRYMFKQGHAQSWLHLYTNGKSAVRPDAPGVTQGGPHVFLGPADPRWVLQGVKRQGPGTVSLASASDPALCLTTHISSCALDADCCDSLDGKPCCPARRPVESCLLLKLALVLVQVGDCRQPTWYLEPTGLQLYTCVALCLHQPRGCGCQGWADLPHLCGGGGTGRQH